MANLYILNDAFTSGYKLNILNIISIFSVLCGVSVIIAKNPIVSVLYLIGLFFTIASYLMSLGLNFIGLSYLLVYVGAVSILFLFILMLINVRISELVTDNNNSIILAILIGLFIITPIYTKGNFHNIIDRLHLSPLRDINNNAGAQNIYFSRLGDSDKFAYDKEQIINNESWLLLKDSMQTLNNVFQNIVNIPPSASLKGLATGETERIDEIHFVTSKAWDSALGEMSHITTIGNIIYTSYPLWLILTSIILLLAMVGAIVITIKQ